MTLAYVLIFLGEAFAAVVVAMLVIKVTVVQQDRRKVRLPSIDRDVLAG